MDRDLLKASGNKVKNVGCLWCPVTFSCSFHSELPSPPHADWLRGPSIPALHNWLAERAAFCEAPPLATDWWGMLPFMVLCFSLLIGGEGARLHKRQPSWPTSSKGRRGGSHLSYSPSWQQLCPRPHQQAVRLGCNSILFLVRFFPPAILGKFAGNTWFCGDCGTVSFCHFHENCKIIN